MVLKIAGWVFSFEQARAWLKKQDHPYQHSPDEFLATELNFWFREKNRLSPVIVLARRRREDPKSTVSRFYRVRELDADREVKKQVLEESGLNDEDLPWVTVADPFFEY
ncbi:uncharacterized protein F5147DRAFT_646948 [Suillus discolor]|uniref:Uncharacterized protein n=1 Tax=Suillus discolor TaxID=1912936 RepID=A0A9P7K0Q6_9AGAM|nr:uncharacterized protein F5147DRAFT_646948 [Suillus discolor]KAG2120440.1 hypothetical protein F5147DRAFT_646948 [Suillus discolor]